MKNMNLEKKNGAETRQN